jgi:hypothetical protein
MGLTNVWLQTQGDGLVRADQVTGIDAHQTPVISGKPARWLLDVVVSVPTGSGGREGWVVSALHRTLIQTSHDPGEAPAALARLLAQLDHVNAAGVIVTSRDEGRRGAERAGEEEEVVTAGAVRFRFQPFAQPDPGRHTAAEYL